MIVESFAVGVLKCNCTIVGDDQTKTAIVIDPGGNVEDILARLKIHGYTLKHIFITHAHFDHVLGAYGLQRSTSAPAHVHENDLFLMNILGVQTQMFGFDVDTTPCELDAFLRDDQSFALGQTSLTVLHTPGHTPGSCSIFGQHPTTPPMLFAGDTLFCEGVGRTDLWGGDFATIVRSIRTKIFSLPLETTVVTGHGDPTTIGHEIAHNPFIRRAR